MVQSFLSLLSFLTGTIFGGFLTVAVIIHFLNYKSEKLEDSPTKSNNSTKNISHKNENIPLSKSDTESLNQIIDYLDDLNNPLKNISSFLTQIHNKEKVNAEELEKKMKNIIDQGTISKIEKDFQLSMSNLKDHGKHIKSISNFFSELNKAYTSFSKDLFKLSTLAKNNMNKFQKLENKEEMINNNWWQILHVTLDHVSSEQDFLAGVISDELLTLINQIHEEVLFIEKKLSNEGMRKFSDLKENISQFESKLRDREKIKDKISNLSTSQTGSAQPSEVIEKKRAKSEEIFKAQVKKLYDVQKEFFFLIPRVKSDCQLAILKSILDTQNLFYKLAEGFDKVQTFNKNSSSQMRAQLSNAASSLVQIIGEENEIQTTTSKFNLVTKHKQKMGFELSLQKILEGLISQSKGLHFESNTDPSFFHEGISHSSTSSSPLCRDKFEENGKLNMLKESTSCLAACNPDILPYLPAKFESAVGTETCVWFNAFSGRLYRDIAHSDYFYKWFCAKLSFLLNKGKKPAFIDDFHVHNIEFGSIPPLLLNVKWSPMFSTRSVNETDIQDKSDTNKKTSKDNDINIENNDFDEDSDSDMENNNDSARIPTKDFSRGYGEKKLPESEYYSACVGDVAFRSGIKFAISTKFWINWPRDRYASVPVTLHIELAELSGKVKFGVTKGYSFVTFLEDPLTRISVRSEVGNDKYKFKDIPKVSDYITKKLKKLIHKKFVYPHSHKFRLIWPRHWWPEGTENEFISTNFKFDPKSMEFQRDNICHPTKEKSSNLSQREKPDRSLENHKSASFNENLNSQKDIYFDLAEMKSPQRKSLTSILENKFSIVSRPTDELWENQLQNIFSKLGNESLQSLRSTGTVAKDDLEIEINRYNSLKNPDIPTHSPWASSLVRSNSIGNFREKDLKSYFLEHMRYLNENLNINSNDRIEEMGQYIDNSTVSVDENDLYDVKEDDSNFDRKIKWSNKINNVRRRISDFKNKHFVKKDNQNQSSQTPLKSDPNKEDKEISENSDTSTSISSFQSSTMKYVSSFFKTKNN